MSTLQQTIESAWERRAELSPATAPARSTTRSQRSLPTWTRAVSASPKKRGGEWVTPMAEDGGSVVPSAENAAIGLARG
jgi:hypothetical protein